MMEYGNRKVVVRNKAPLTFTMLLLASLTAIGGRAECAAAKTVTFAYNTPTLSGTLPIVVAQDFGFLAVFSQD
jgi:hypothetical protein